MNTLLIIAICIATFFISYGIFTLCGSSSVNLGKFKIIKSPIVPFLGLGFIGCLLSYLIAPQQYDALSPTSAWTVVTAFASAAVLWTLLSQSKLQKFGYVFILACCALNLWILPNDFSFSDGALPIWAEKIILAIAWSLFALCYNTMNAGDGILSSESLSITIGLVLLCVIGVLPVLSGYYAAVFIALFMALHFFMLYPAKIALNSTQCRLLGYLLGWLGVLSAIEGSGSCFLILAMYYIFETSVAFFKKLTFKKQYRNMAANTFYSNLTAAGVAPKTVSDLVSRINLILMLLAGFQIYSPNNFTMIIIAFIAVFWLQQKALSPTESGRHVLLFGNLISALRPDNKEPTEPQEQRKK